MNNENGNENERIDEIKSELYSRGREHVKGKRNNITQLQRKDIKNSWGKLPEDNQNNEELYKFRREGPSIFSIMLVVSLVFFVTAAAFALFFLNFNQNEVKNEVAISITGPNAIKSGEPLDFLIKMENPTDLDYRDIEFFVEYPESTIDTETKSVITNKTVPQESGLLSGGSVGKKFSAILSGTAGDIKDIEITIFYKAGDFSNTLIAKRIYTVEIDAAPVTIEMEYPKEVLSDKSFEFNLNILSNTADTLNDLVVVSKYPSGFKLESSVPEAVFSNISQNVFKVDELKAGEKKSIKITGTLLGQNNEDKFFIFELGDSVPFRNEIRTLFSRTEEEISIKKPDIDLAVTSNFDNQIGEAIVSAGKVFDINSVLSNNLNSLISDIKITASFPGDLILKEKVIAKNGFYNSNENQIVWDKNTNPEMKAITGGDFLSNEFSLELIGLEEIAGYIKDPSITIDFEVEGTNFDDQNSEGAVLEKFSKNVKVPTTVFLKTAVLQNEGPFENTGNINPEVGKPTTYTIQWQVYNTSSDITDTKITATLPPYVTYLDKTSPENAYVAYNADKREVTWTQKKIEAFIGYRTDPKTMHFQVEYIPTDPQTGDRTTIVEGQTLTTTDTYIDRTIEILGGDGRIGGVVGL